MDISNTISYDSSRSAESTYNKNNMSDQKIKQTIPKPIENYKFTDKLQKINEIEKINRLDKLEEARKLDEIKKTADELNKEFLTFDRKLDISVHEKTKQVMVKIVDTSTDKIIREIPPEEVLDTIAKRKELLGIMVDEQI